jgi:energy-coupling factor transport system ATP-binding protein
MITFEHLTFTYPNAAQPILRDVNLNIAAGAFALLCGSSGAGKSTLLRCLNGLVPHFSGGVMRGTVRVNDLNPVLATPQVMSRHVGFVFQDPEAQFVTDVVEDEIAFALENAAAPRAEMRVRIEEALDLLELAALRDRALNTLSGGERQRVAIAAALALRPRVLALDEPTSQLDPKSAEDVLQALVRLNTDLGLTIVLVEHRLERVLPFVDTLIHLHPDRPAVLSGSPREVLAAIDLTPPLVTLGKALHWRPLPLTIKDGLAWSAKTLAEKSRAAINAPSVVKASSDQPVYLEARHVEAGYGQQRILRDLSLTVRSGEIVALIGRNGSGKTTLLKTIVGLLPVQRGEVRVAGQSIAGQSVADICRHVGYLPQDPNALLFADTVEDELRITLRNHGLSAAEANAAPVVSDLLGRLNLTDKASAYPRDLSVGERQRVALGAIAVTQPGALLLDEPTRGLDYVAKQNLSRLLSNWRDAGMAILIVTHDVELVAEIADRVVLLSQGEIIAAGSPDEVLGASPFFAPQIARLFPGRGWLTVSEALQGLGPAL